MGGAVAGLGIKELLKMLAVSTGADIFSGIGESLMGKSPYEQAMGQQAGAMNQMMPQLMQEAQGIPSMATRNMMREADTGINREQQSFMASQMRANPYQTKINTATRSTLPRFTQMKQDANRNILGQAQQNARGALLGIGQNAQTQIGIAEQRRTEKRAVFNEGVMKIMGFYKGVNDPSVLARLENMMDLMGKLFGVSKQSLMGGQGAGASGDYYNTTKTRSYLEPES